MKPRDYFQYILGIVIVVGFFGLLFVLVFSKIPNENSDLLNLVVGALIGSFSGVVSYYFGSSAGSKAKDETLSNIANKT